MHQLHESKLKGATHTTPSTQENKEYNPVRNMKRKESIETNQKPEIERKQYKHKETDIRKHQNKNRKKQIKLTWNRAQCSQIQQTLMTQLISKLPEG